MKHNFDSFRIRIGVLILALAFFAPAYPTFAQSSTGAIGGTVTDPSGGTLQGAKVAIGEKGVSEVTDQQGSFFRSDLPPGTYAVTITYVGFKTFEKTVTVTPGRTTHVSAELQLASQSQRVIVTAPTAGGEAAAINMERTSSTLTEVVPRQVIRSLPNANIADAVGRLPNVTLDRDEGEGKYIQIRGTEPRLTNATIDGVNIPSAESDVRQTKFDIIPASSVEYVTVHKTPQANMEGDGIGGSVNLVTKMATNKPDLSFGAMGGYTPIINGRGLTEEDGTFGQRFGAQKKFGFLVSGSYDWNGRGIDDMEPAPDIATLPNGTTQRWFDAVDMRQYMYFRTRWGVNGGIDYRIHQGDVYLKWFRADFQDDEHKWVYSLTDNTPNVNLLNGNGGGTGVPALENPLSATNNETVGTLILGGNQVLRTTWYTWNVDAAHAGTSGGALADTTFTYTGGNTSNCDYNPTATTSEYLPQWSTSCFTEAYNPANWALDSNSTIQRDGGLTAQLNLEASGAMGKRFNIGSHSATIQFGGRFTNAHKYANTYSLVWTPNAGVSIPLTTFPRYVTNNNYYLGGKYKMGYLPSGYAINAYLQNHPSQFSLYSTKGIDPSYFDLIEKVPAGFVMTTIDLSSRLHFYAGLRVEHTSDSVKNFSQNLNGTNCVNSTCVVPNSFSGSYTTVLPSASLAYGINRNNVMRFVYARGLARPAYSDLAQALSWGTNGNGANKYNVSFGNANLKAETGDDIDILYEHYFSSFGMLSGGFFYKYLGNPIVPKSFQLKNYQPPGGPLGNYVATEPINAGHAWVLGFEASYIQRFTFLPGAWKGLGLTANYGHNVSRTFGIPNRTDNPPLERTDPNAFNLIPTYAHGRLFVGVGMSYNGPSIHDYEYFTGTPGGLYGPLSDVYFYSHFQVDAQGSIYMGRGLKLILSGLNLNNAVFGFYQGSPQYMIQREYYLPSFSMGIRWSPGFERAH